MGLLLPAALLLAVGCSPSVKYPSTGSMWPTPTPAPYASQPRFLITNNLSDELSVIADNGNNPQLLANVPVGDVPLEIEAPHHLGVSPDGRFIYYNLSNYTSMVNTGSGPHGAHGTGTVPGTLVKLDARTYENLGEAVIDKNPGDVIISPDGKLAFSSHFDVNKASSVKPGDPPEAGYSTVAIVDTTTMNRLSNRPICPTAHGEALSADGKTLYVSCSLSDQLAIVDVSDPVHPVVKSLVLVGPVKAPNSQTYFPYAVTVSPKDGTVWVSNNNSADVRVYDPATGQMDDSRRVTVDGRAFFSAFAPDGDTFYVPSQVDDKLYVVDVPTMTKRAIALPPSACHNAHVFFRDPMGGAGFVVCEGFWQPTDPVRGPGSIVRIALDSLSVTGFTPLGMYPDGIAFAPPAP